MQQSSQNIKPKQLVELALQLSKGEELAIAKIYQLTYTRLYYFGLQIAGKHQQTLVEGTIQDFFIWLAKNYQKVNLEANFEAYLYQSIRRNLQQQLQAAQAKSKAQKRYLQNNTPNIAPHQVSPETDYLKKETQALDKAKIDALLQDLPTYQKEVLYLRFYENRNYKEIAAILAVNAQVARNYVFRAITTLRKKLLVAGYWLLVASWIGA